MFDGTEVLRARLEAAQEQISSLIEEKRILSNSNTNLDYIYREQLERSSKLKEQNYKLIQQQEFDKRTINWISEDKKRIFKALRDKIREMDSLKIKLAAAIDRNSRNITEIAQLQRERNSRIDIESAQLYEDLSLRNELESIKGINDLRRKIIDGQAIKIGNLEEKIKELEQSLMNAQSSNFYAKATNITGFFSVKAIYGKIKIQVRPDSPVIEIDSTPSVRMG